MTDILYEDYQIVYCGGDPRLDIEKGTKVVIRLDDAAITMQPNDLHSDSVMWPKAAIISVHCADVSCPYVNPKTEWCRRGICLQVKDPEQIYAPGFRILLACRNEYYSRILTKRIAGCYHCKLEQSEPDVPF